MPKTAITVSKLCKVNDLGLTLLKYTKAFTPVPSRTLHVWEKDWANALTGVPYVRVTRSDSSGPLHRMLHFTCVMKVKGMNTRMVREEFERVWQNQIASDLESAHSIRDTQEGFDFCFLALDSSMNYITGSVSVLEKLVTK